MLKSKGTLVVCLVVFGLGMGTMHASSALAQRSASPGGRLWAHFAGKADAQPAEGDCPMARIIHQHFGRLLDLRDELKITAEQRDAIHAILRNHRDELRPTIKAVVEKHQTLRDAVIADETGEAAIRAAATDMGAAIGDAAVVAAQVVEEVKGVLTAEQLQKLREFHADRQRTVDAILEHLSGD